MTLGFDPKSKTTERIVKLQTDAWDIDEDTTYVVVDDCGPCVIAAFSFRHNAADFLRVCGEDCYMVDKDGVAL